MALTASYSSPTATENFSSALPALPSDPPSQSVADKTAYLSALRAGATQVQADINAFLTRRMDEDNVAAEREGQAAVKEDRAEEMYGEEGGEDDGGARYFAFSGANPSPQMPIATDISGTAVIVQDSGANDVGIHNWRPLSKE
ncbi:hypothetical protein LTR53_016051 [Teratosphaeriaceae sp. CCFEE 6253]|nr:hypothetical protein LTR53_016051 [Teratosphaeriaceae sp. CCFEE 6253]